MSDITTGALSRTYAAQDLLGFISVRADEEWGADRHSDSGRLEAVGAALGLVAGYDGEGVSEKVRFRLSHGAGFRRVWTLVKTGRACRRSSTGSCRCLPRGWQLGRAQPWRLR